MLDHCYAEGGDSVWWSKEKTYKNAIPNELFLVLAARLYQRTAKPEYLQWALKEWTWFNQSGDLTNTCSNQCRHDQSTLLG